jgi:hypothetical protein
MPGAVDEDQRVLAEQGLEVAGVEGAGGVVVGREDRPHVLRFAGEDDAVAGEPALEDRPEPPAT